LSAQVNLVEVTAKNLRDVLRLKVAPEQDGFVAPNAYSIAEAHFEPAAWFRAIEADGALVGFAMIYDPTLTEAELSAEERERIYLWRFMVDAGSQKKGYGAKALDLLRAHAKTRSGIKRFLASYVEGPEGPEDFYLRYGFKKTGNVPEGEVEIEIDL